MPDCEEHKRDCCDIDWFIPCPATPCMKLRPQELKCSNSKCLTSAAEHFVALLKENNFCCFSEGKQRRASRVDWKLCLRLLFAFTHYEMISPRLLWQSGLISSFFCFQDHILCATCLNYALPFSISIWISSSTHLFRCSAGSLLSYLFKARHNIRLCTSRLVQHQHIPQVLPPLQAGCALWLEKNGGCSVLEQDVRGHSAVDSSVPTFYRLAFNGV